MPISIYCERLAPGVLGEPLNTLTNLAFLYAAGLCWRHAGRRSDQRLLAALLASIGVGSLLFHAFATPLTQLADVVPIALFQLCYLTLYLRRVAHCEMRTSLAWLTLYVAALAFASQLPPWFNGSMGYAPAAVALCLLGVLHWRRTRRVDVLLAAALFGVSLVARSVDLVLCARWPTGTHFLWHLLNAVMLYQLTRAYRRACETPSLNH